MRGFATLPGASPHSSHLHTSHFRITHKFKRKLISSAIGTKREPGGYGRSSSRLSSHSRTQHQMVWLAVFGNNDVTIRTVNVGGANASFISAARGFWVPFPVLLQYKNETRVNTLCYPGLPQLPHAFQHTNQLCKYRKHKRKDGSRGGHNLTLNITNTSSTRYSH